MAATATNEVKELRDQVTKSGEVIATLTKELAGLKDTLSRQPMPGMPTPQQVFGAPGVRRGENTMTSRGFSFMKMLGLLTGACSAEDATVEMDVHSRLHNCYVKDAGPGTGYNYLGKLPGSQAFMAPLATGFMHEAVVPAGFRAELKSLVRAGLDGADPTEAQWIAKRMGGYWGQYAGQQGRKDLSWLNETLGGALVAPPEQGELIELLRNKEALVNAGARTVPLPPQGRIRYPRQTMASTTYWVGENKLITSSDIGTGDVSLQAKKLAVLVKAPNELIRFASPAAEALMRDDMTKSLALGLDLAGLQGTGGDTQPLGVINFQNINRIASSSPGANGDQLVGNDIYRMVASLEEANAEMEGWIMRPKTLYRYYQLRADAVAQGDQQGPFLFDLIRPAELGAKDMLAGYPVTKSTQVSQARSKGSATNLTYILAGMWSDMLIGMFGAIEFSATNQGDTSFQADQTWVKGILSADIQLRHESAFTLMDNLIVVPA